MLKQNLKMTAVITGLAVVSLSSIVEAKEFKDVKPKDWFYPVVTNLSDRGVINGYKDGTFKPSNSVTYAEYLTLLNNELGVKQEKGQGRWFESTINYLKQQGVVDEITDPNAAITRAEVAKYTTLSIEKLQGKTLTEGTSNLNDLGAINPTYKTYVLKLQAAGVMKGDDKGNFNPTKRLTRAESAQIIANIKGGVQAPTPQPEKPKKYSNEGTYMTIEDYERLEQAEGLQITDPDKPLVWKEKMQRPYVRQPKEGDTIIKADGTRVVLKIHPISQILGEGQGVDAYTGLQFELGGNLFNENISGFDGWTSSDGYGGIDDMQGQPYIINSKTGEAHFRGEWVTIQGHVQTPPYVLPSGEVVDYNKYYKVGDRPQEVTIGGQTYSTRGWMEWTGTHWQSIINKVNI